MYRLTVWAAPHRFILLVLAARLALGLAFALLNPPWEAYDEDGHFAYARYLARYHHLLQPGDPEAEAVWEKFQPPLYYILIAPLIAGFDLGPTFQAPERNPYLATPNAGLNYALHPEPLTPTLLALYVGRAGSVLISTLSVLWAYGLTRRVWPKNLRAAQTATLLYAFWPQFLFVGSMLSNDVLATALATLCLHSALALAQAGFRWRSVLGMGLSLFAALLTKINAFALIPVALVAVMLAWRTAPHTRGAPPARLALAALIILPILASLALNASPFITGQVFQLQTLANFVNRTTQGASTQQANFIGAALPYAFKTMLASYGWGNVESFAWLYGLWGAGALLAVAGLGLGALRFPFTTRNPALLLLSLHAFTLFSLSLALAIAQQDIFLVPGRYLLPGLPALCCLLVMGWHRLTPSAWRLRMLRSISIGVVVLGWATPLWVIAPTYAPPRPLVTQPDVPLSIQFGNSIELIGYNQPAPLRPGENLSLEVCWRTLAPISKNYPVLVVLVGADGQGYGRAVTHAGEGNYPTSAWQVNEPFCDHYRLSIGTALPLQYQAHVQVSLLMTSDPNGERVPVTAATAPGIARVETYHVALPVRVAMPTAPTPAGASLSGARFGEVLRLKSYTVEAPSQFAPLVTALFQWEALADLNQNYTLFVHLRDAPTNAYAQADGPPLDNAFPTFLWQTGEVVLDVRTFYFSALTPPPLDLYLGVLDSAGQRLPAFDAQGQPSPNGEVILERGLRFTFIEPTGVIYLPFVARTDNPSSELPAYP